ncbi:MAG TPA: glycosyltransferase [Thermoleophilaceae bacterium]
MTLEGTDIVCVGFADWDTDLRTNQHHLMARLGQGNRVLFVESMGLRQPQLSSRDLRRIARRLVRGVQPPRAADGVHVLSPLVIPLHRYGAVRAINKRLLPWLVRRAARRLGMSAPILWAYVPQAEVLIDSLRPSKVVYHCVDDMANQKGIDGASFRAAEERFTKEADLVFATSAPLAERLANWSGRVVTMTNVADTDLFAGALGDGPIDPALERLPAPRIVFTGAIVTTKLDVDLLVGLARARRDWSIALVGPIGPGDPSTDVSPLRAEPNIHLLGKRPYEQLPDVLRGADAALIPYARNELTASIFPMKVYEYLAAGLPVVAAPLPSLEGVEGIDTASGPEATATKLDELLAADGPEARQARSRLAAKHSWDVRMEEIAIALEAHG